MTAKKRRNVRSTQPPPDTSRVPPVLPPAGADRECAPDESDPGQTLWDLAGLVVELDARAPGLFAALARLIPVPATRNDGPNAPLPSRVPDAGGRAVTIGADNPGSGDGDVAARRQDEFRHLRDTMLFRMVIWVRHVQRSIPNADGQRALYQNATRLLLEGIPHWLRIMATFEANAGASAVAPGNRGARLKAHAGARRAAARHGRDSEAGR